MTTITEMRVSMDCPGCENAVKKSLEKIKGVDEVDIDMAMQKVTVTGCAEQKKILKAVRRTGKRAELWQFPYNPETRSHNNQCNHQHSNYGSAVAVGNGVGSTQFAAQPQPSSSYNYYKHGYQGDHYQGYTYYNNYNPTNSSSSIVGGRPGDVFSDENPHGCSIV